MLVKTKLWINNHSQVFAWVNVRQIMVGCPESSLYNHGADGSSWSPIDTTQHLSGWNSPWAPMGAQGEGPKGPKPCKFQTSSSPDPEGEWSSYVVCRYHVRWRIKVVHGSSQGGPNRPLWGPFVKSNWFHLLFENAWLDFNQTWQESSLGAGDSKLFIWYMWLLWGGPGGGPQGPENFANFKLPSPDPV